MKQTAKALSITLMLFLMVAMGCRGESPTEHVETSTDKAAEAIERAINTPIEKARAVEGTLQGAAERTAEQTQKAGE